MVYLRSLRAVDTRPNVLSVGGVCVLWYRSEIDVKGDAYYCRLGVDIAYLRFELEEESGAPDSRLKVLQTCLHIYTSMYARVSFHPVNTTYI